MVINPAISKDVFKRHIDNRQRNQGFNDVRGNADNAVMTETQRHRMRKGKRCHLCQQRLPAQAQQKQAKYEQNVVEAFRQNMGETDYEISRDFLHEAFGNRDSNRNGPKSRASR